jgi:hypothetical protein
VRFRALVVVLALAAAMLGFGVVRAGPAAAGSSCGPGYVIYRGPGYVQVWNPYTGCQTGWFWIGYTASQSCAPWTWYPNCAGSGGGGSW